MRGRNQIRTSRREALILKVRELSGADRDGESGADGGTREALRISAQ